MIFSKAFICNLLLLYPEEEYINTMQFFLIFLIFLVQKKLYSKEWFMIDLLIYFFFWSFSGLKVWIPTVLSPDFYTLSKS